MSSFDLDDLFAYSTIKVVRIRDRWLGMLNYALMLAIFVYVIISTIWLDNGSFVYEVPKGSVRFSLKRPVNPLTPGCDPDETSGPNDPACLSVFTPLNQLPYCLDSGNMPYVLSCGTKVRQRRGERPLFALNCSV